MDTYCTLTIMMVASKSLYYSIDGVAWDWVGEKLYWTDECNNRIEVYDPATLNRKVLFDTGSSSNPRGIVVDPGTRYEISVPCLIDLRCGM